MLNLFCDSRAKIANRKLGFILFNWSENCNPLCLRFKISLFNSSLVSRKLIPNSVMVELVSYTLAFGFVFYRVFINVSTQAFCASPAISKFWRRSHEENIFCLQKRYRDFQNKIIFKGWKDRRTTVPIILQCAKQVCMHDY